MGKNPAKDKGTAPGKSGKAGKGAGGTIALNKRARHEYHLEQRFEAGLASAKRIVDRHGGELRAEGREGAGATFWFTLPGSMSER